jgi:hypothetical protein
LLLAYIGSTLLICFGPEAITALTGHATGCSRKSSLLPCAVGCLRYVELVEVEVNLRPTVSRTVCLGVRSPSGTRDQFLFLLEILFRQLRVCYFVAPSLTRGRVCNLLCNCFWALLEQSLLGRSPKELKQKTNKLHGLSPRANCTDRATAASRRSGCQLLRMKDATWSA